MLRTRTCGELRKENVGEEVVLSGWVSKVRNLGALVFVDLRDRYGFTQINISPELFEKKPLKNEYCVQVEGKVSLKDVPNKNLATGEIEVIASEIKVYSSSIVPPFIIADKTDALEDTRLKDRFLDLRRPYLQNNLILRSKIVKSVHEFFDNLGFVEVETPTLVKSTPEGARDYLVPSRIKKGAFYALPQSPQIYKQLLMISGMDRYYQVARCYRDEDLRADRQPEFTQVDVEMSFVEREDVLKVIEDLLNKVFKDTISYDLGKFKRISYKDAIELYGSDKPDMRFDLLLKDISFISSKGFEAYKDKAVKCLVVPSLASQTTRKIMDSDNLEAKKYGIHGVSHLKYENGVLTGSIVKYFAKETIDELVSYLGLKDGDLVIVGADANRTRLSEALGSLRLIYGDKLGLRNKDIYVPLFVIDWPLFDREDGKIVSLSNPFTRPRDEDLPLLDEDPTKVLSYAYDTVINGMELSSGSLRIYDGNLQKKVFELLGLTDEDIKNRFGFFVDAFKYGTPPHGGFGIGLDRLAMQICKTDNVRDVIAFPKNLKAYCMMADCPCEVPQENIDILGIKIKDEE